LIDDVMGLTDGMRCKLTYCIRSLNVVGVGSDEVEAASAGKGGKKTSLVVMVRLSSVLKML